MSDGLRQHGYMHALTRFKREALTRTVGIVLH